MTPEMEALQRISLFSGLSEDGLALLGQIAVQSSHRKGEVIFSHGDPGDRLFVVVSGRVRVSRDIPGIGEEALAILNPGEVFGEMALIDDSPRSATVRVHESCELIALPKDGFDDLLFLHKDLAYEVLWGFVRLLNQRLRQTTDKITFLSISGKF